eukprot:4655916-Alexandrium_andersonii.AAC.1
MFLLGRCPQVGPVLERAEKQLEPIPAQGRPALVRLALGFDHCQFSGSSTVPSNAPFVADSSWRSPSWPESAMDWSSGASSFANTRRQRSQSCSASTRSAGRTRASAKALQSSGRGCPSG